MDETFIEKKKKKITSFLKFTQISIFLQKRMNRYISYQWDLTRKGIIFRIGENFYRDDILNFTTSYRFLVSHFYDRTIKIYTSRKNASRIDLNEHNLSIIISYIRFVSTTKNFIPVCKEEREEKKKKGTKFSVDSWGGDREGW